MTKRQKKSLTRIIIAAVLMIILKFLPVEGWLKFVLYMVPYLVVGYDILRKAFKGILNKQVFDENFLMAVATIGAIALGNYKEGVSVMLFYQIGELFQSYAVGKSRRNISDLMDIRPDYANIEKDGDLEQVDPDEVEVGTVIVVQPGEKVPIDGVIEEGSSTLNTSALTGESVPREAAAGDEVISGCINLTGLLKIRTTKEFGESTVSKILDLVENSSMKKSKSENFITKFARYYTPAVCYSALALAILPPVINLIMGNPAAWSTWIIRALTFLVISCPCALVISIPLSFFGGIGAASACGILVKGSNYLEAMSETKYVVFDKTGTLTEGHPTVTDLSAGLSQAPLSRILFTLESASEHPLAQAIVHHLAAQPLPMEGFESLTGLGVRGKINGTYYYAGNRRLLEQHGLAIPASLTEEATRLSEEAKTVIWLSDEKQALGVVAIADRIKPTSKEAVMQLQEMGISTYMLTGDNPETARKIAEQCGITHFQAEVLPQQKAQFIQELQRQGKVVAMVGDGINDSAALAQADLSIAMGKGSDIAMDVAKMTLISSDLNKITDAIRLSQATVRTIRENLFWAFIYNLIGIPVAAGILYPINGFLLNPMIAGAAMAMSSVSVVSNSLRLKRKKLAHAHASATVAEKIPPVEVPPVETRPMEVQPLKAQPEPAQPSAASSPAPAISSVQKTYLVEGMMCDHCRTRVEKVLNTVEGATAQVTLTPPEAMITFRGKVPTVEELQHLIDEKAGDYTLSEKN